jgi:L-malate glycosyltransferase
MDTLKRKYTRMSYPVNDNRIPVLHIIKSLGRGGAEILLPETLRQHDKVKFHFHYIYFLPWKNQVVEEIQQAGGTVVCMPAKNNLRIILKAREIATYIREHKIQLVHCHLPWAGIVGRLAGRLTGVPVVYTEHNKWERYHRITYHLNKLSFSNQKVVIAVSGEVARSIKTHYHKAKPDVQVVLNGADTHKYSIDQPVQRDIRKELSIPATDIVIGIACVFRAQKRLTIWLEIAHSLRKKNPNISFIVVGDGVLKEEIAAKAKELDTAKYVHFVGLQTDTRPFFKAMDIFMMSSEFEGLPIALLEAMSMNCVPACTAAGGIPEAIEDGVNGLLVPVEQPLQLVDKIEGMLQQPGKLQQMKKAARETVINSFSMQKMVGHLEVIYNSLIKQ